MLFAVGSRSVSIPDYGVAHRSGSSSEHTVPPTHRVNHRRSLLAAVPGFPILHLLLPRLAASQEAELVNKVSPLSNLLQSPAAFYRSRQQAGGGAKILAPIRGSRAGLERCRFILNDGGPNPYVAMLRLARSASMNCYLYEPNAGEGWEARASLIQQSLPFSDPCTLRLIYKNSITLNKDPALQQQGKVQLERLIRNFQLLDDMLERASQGDQAAVQQVPKILDDAIETNAGFEATILACLGL
ncbi:hypothetical protein ACKKBG_A25330 [Auxenochlorella protothecoides x Auxenochlorella symbiontica]